MWGESTPNADFWGKNEFVLLTPRLSYFTASRALNCCIIGDPEVLPDEVCDVGAERGCLLALCWLVPAPWRRVPGSPGGHEGLPAARSPSDFW